MASYSDSREARRRFSEADPAAESTLYDAREQEDPLLEDSSSETDHFGRDPEKVIATTELRTHAPHTSVQKIMGFFVLVLLVSTIIFSQLLIHAPDDADEQGSQGVAGMKPAEPAPAVDVLPPPPPPPPPEEEYQELPPFAPPPPMEDDQMQPPPPPAPVDDDDDDDDDGDDMLPPDMDSDMPPPPPPPPPMEEDQQPPPVDDGTLPPVPSAPAPQDYLLSPTWDFEAPPTRREFFWTIGDVERNPDGVYRQMMLINEQFPGPLVEVNEGDTVVVHVNNQAANATSIHWHGMYQNGTNWMDGTVGVTQCPIAPGASFTYEFTADNQYGTYWYHSHQGVQSADGLHGPLIIHSRREQNLQEVQYATDRVVMVSDYYYDTSNALLMEYLASNKENEEPVPQVGLINGRGIQDCSLYPERRCDNSTAGYPQMNLEPGLNHRLRIINTGSFAEFRISLDEHEFAVTEVDGTVVKPAYYDRLSINPAQRYSIVINSTLAGKDAFWLRAEMYTGCFQKPDKRLNAEAKAVVNYGAADAPFVAQLPRSIDLPNGPSLQCRDMDTTELVAVPAVAAPAKADAVFYLRSNFEIGAYRLSRGFFNASSWRADVKHPSLHRAIDGLSSGNTSFDAASQSEALTPHAFVNDAAFDTGRELVIQTQGVQTLDFVVSNFDDGNHPLHLHGYKFFVLAQGHGYPPADIYDTLDLSNPLRRDTASVEGYGWSMLRVVADNPGAWALHCHISWHAEAGLLMQLVSRVDQLGTQQLPQANRDLCRPPAAELRKGMTPADEVFMVPAAPGPEHRST